MSFVQHGFRPPSMPLQHAFYSGAFTDHSRLPTVRPDRHHDVYLRGPSAPQIPVIAASGATHGPSHLTTKAIPPAGTVVAPSDRTSPVVARADLGTMLLFAASVIVITYALRFFEDMRTMRRGTKIKRKIFADVTGAPDRIMGSSHAIPSGVTPGAVEALDAFAALAPNEMAGRRLQVLWTAKIIARAGFEGRVRIPHVVRAVRAAMGIVLDPLELKKRFQEDPGFANADFRTRRSVLGRADPHRELLRFVHEDDPGKDVGRLFERMAAFTFKVDGAYQPLVKNRNLGKAWWLFCSCCMSDDVVPKEFFASSPSTLIPPGNLGPVPLALIQPGLNAHAFWQRRINLMLGQIAKDPLFRCWFAAVGKHATQRGSVFRMLRQWDALPYEERSRQRSSDDDCLRDLLPDRMDVSLPIMSRLWALKTLEGLRMEEKLYRAYLTPWHA